MNNNVVQVYEKEIQVSYLVNSFSMSVYITELDKNCCCCVTTYDKNDVKLYDTQIIIEGEEYYNWGNDDDYLKNLVSNKLNLVIKQ